MRFALVISLALHASLIVVTVYGLPHLLDEPPPAQQIMVVDLVEIAEETTPQLPELQQVDETRPPDVSESAPETAKEAEQVEAPPPATAEAPPPPPPPATSEVKVALAAPTAPTPVAEARPAPTPAPKPVEVKPEAPPPEIKPAEVKPEAAAPPPEIKPAEVKDPTPPPPPQAKPTPVETVTPPEAKLIEGTEVASAPVPKRKPREEPKKKKDFKRTMSRVAALLDKSSEDTPETASRAKRAAAPKAERSAAKTPRTRGRAVRLDQRMTMREIDAIKLQIEQCWTVPAGARDAAELIIRIRIQLNRDGSLARSPEVLDGHKLRRRGGFQRAAAESALRAVNTCQPLRNLPVAKYDQWRDITLSFDPREMLGR